MHTLRYDTIDSIASVALSGDGRVLAGVGHQVLLWNSILDEPTVLPHPTKLGSSDVLCVTFSPSGDLVAVFENGRIGIFSAPFASYGLPRRLHWYALHPSEPLIACGTGSSVHVWDIASRKMRFAKSLGANFRGALSFDPTRNAIVTGSSREFRFWVDPSATSPFACIAVQPDYPLASSCSPDGQWIAVAFEHCVRIWEIETNTLVKELPVTSQLKFTTIAFHPNGKLITTGSRGLVQLWDPHSWSELTAYAWRIGWTRAFALSPDGTTAAVGGNLGHVAIWDFE